MADEFSFDVFLSHSSRDKEVVRELAERLKRDGLRVWFDQWEIQPGDSIPSKIEEGLEHSRVLVLCMSANAFGSDWSQLESGTFRFRDPLNKDRRFIPLRLDESTIKGSMAQFHYIKWFPEDREREYAKLLEACQPPSGNLAFARSHDAIDVVSEQISSAKEINPDHQSIAEDIKSHITMSMRELMSQLTQYDKTNHEGLSKRYPFGYVLFGGQGGDRVNLPFKRGEIYPEAKWEEAEVILDSQNKTMQTTIPNPIWRWASGGKALVTIRGYAISQGSYSLGEPVALNAVRVEVQPNMYLEVIDDDPTCPTYVLGFKE